MCVLKTFIFPHPPLIVPEVGKGEEQKIAKTIAACEQAGREIAALQPETIVVITPHAVAYADYIHLAPGLCGSGTLADFQAPDVILTKDYDTDFVAALEREATKAQIHAGTLGEKDRRLDHGTLVPLYFVEKYWPHYQLVRVSISGLSDLQHYRFGACMAQVAESLHRRTVFIASGDLSHRLHAEGPYGFAKEGPLFDRQLTEMMSSGDFLALLQLDKGFSEAAGSCGLLAFMMMAGVLDGKAVLPQLLSYEGPFGVGYAVAAFTPREDDRKRYFAERYEAEQEMMLRAVKEKEDAYVRLARCALEHYVREKSCFVCPSDLLPEFLEKRAGVFVSLKKEGRLRGCIGTIAPVTSCVAEEILRNAVSAGTEDPRFAPVSAEELPALVYSVDVLGEPEWIEHLSALDVQRYGVIVTKGERMGVLLPNLAGIETVEQQVEIALQKAGIDRDEDFSLERFVVVRHE